MHVNNTTQPHVNKLRRVKTFNFDRENVTNPVFKCWTVSCVISLKAPNKLQQVQWSHAPQQSQAQKSQDVKKQSLRMKRLSWQAATRVYSW